MKTKTPGPTARLVLLATLAAALTGCRSAARRPELVAIPVHASAAGFAQDSSGGHETFQDEFDDFDAFDEFEDYGEISDPGELFDGEIEEVFDPLSGMNRAVFAFNDWFFLNLWSPVADGYRWLVPEPARVAVDRMFKNLLTPARLVNSVLQLRFGKAGLELGRVVVNSTLGIGGLFDPAQAWFGWQAPDSEDFGQTLGNYGIGAGFPIVLPFLGPSNLRDGLSLIPDSFLNPVIYYTTTPESFAISVSERFNRTSLHIGEYESLKADALDAYTLFRDAYHQNRLKKIEE